MWRDDAYLLDILIAARKVLRYTRDLGWEEFQDDELTQDAVLRNLQIAGEAVRKISPELQQEHPEIPWARIAGLRNRLVHEYFRIDVEKIWQTVQEDLPGLVAAIEPLIPPEEEI